MSLSRRTRPLTALNKTNNTTFFSTPDYSKVHWAW